MDPKTLAAMLDRDREEWAALSALLDARPQGALHDPESPRWEARDVYGHLARWINVSTDDLEARLAGRSIPHPEGTDDEINTRWQAEDSHLSFEEARRRAHEAFERRIQAIQSVARHRWNPLIEAIARADGAHHYAGHRSYITGRSE